MQGSETQWYKNVLKNPSIRIDARGVDAAFRASPVTGANAVKSVIEKFRGTYGAGDVKKHFSRRAAVGEPCELNRGAPRTERHRDRKLSAAEFVETKPINDNRR